MADCYFMASLGAIATTHPEVLEAGITTTPDGDFNVRLFRTNRFQTVRLPPEFPVFDDGSPRFARTKPDAEGNYELWPLLYERAAAVFDGYSGIGNGGTAGAALTMLTGQPSRAFDMGTGFSAFAREVKAHHAIVFTMPANSSHVLFKKEILETWHTYWVESVDERTMQVTLRNPWGWHHKPIVVTWLTLEQIGASATVNPVVPSPPR